jgi:hypothetical protein
MKKLRIFAASPSNVAAECAKVEQTPMSALTKYCR